MRVRLEDVCEKESSKLKQSDVIDQNGLYPVYGASGYLGNINTYQQSNYYIAVVKDGAGIGRTMLLPPESSIIGTMQYLIPKDNVLPEYLYYVVKAKHLEKYFSGATIPHIYFKDYKNEQFDLVSFEEQRVIINRLKKIEIIIDNLSKNLLLLDELVRARFVEMFGDPLINSCQLPVQPMTDICDIIDGDRGKNYPKSEEILDDGYCLFLNAKNVTQKGFDFENCNFITREKDDALRNGKLSRGDVVLTTRGTVGNLAFYSKNVPYDNIRINSGMVILRMNRSILNEIYFIELFKMKLSDIKEKIASGSAQPQLPISTMNKIILMIPPLELQNQFASFVKEIDKSGIIESLSQRIYKLRVDILYALEQNATDQDYVDEINKQIKEMSDYIQALNEDSFNVKLRLKYVHQYKNPDNWRNLNEMDTHYIKDELSSLVVIHDEDTQAKFFDRQMYMIEMAYLNHYDATSVINNVVAIANELYKKQAIPDIARNAEYLKCAKDSDYWKTANYFDLEILREKIRGLIKYLTKIDPVKPIDTHFTDEIIETKVNDAFYNDEGLENYKEKVQHYLKAHEDDEAIYKLRHNQVITPDEMKHLENLLWIDLGSKDDYRIHFGDTPITRLIRKIVGLDRQAAMAEFSRFLDDQSLNSRQIHFVELLVDYIVKNGFIEDKKVLLQDPFKSIGSMSALFKDKMNIAREILKTVDTFSERL